MALACEGRQCAGGTLWCTTFHVPAPAPGVSGAQGALEVLPLGQIVFWLAARTVEERRELIENTSDIRTDGFDAAFAIDRMDDREYASASSEIGAKNGAIKLFLALWLGPQSLHGMRCSYLDGGQIGASERIDSLLGMLLEDRAERF